MEKRELFPLAVEIQAGASLLLKFFNQGVEGRLEEHGYKISSLQYGIMNMLQVEAVTISEISRRLGMDPSTLVRTVDSLEKKDLVKRGSDPKDRRRNPISLTEKGKKLLQEVPVIREGDPVFKALESLGLEESKTLRDLLIKSIRNIPEGRVIVDFLSQYQKP